MADKPNDRLKPNGSSSISGTPRISRTVEIKIPDKEVHLKSPDEEGAADGTCSCHSVCTCVPVAACNCHAVCVCDSVCSTNACSCHPFEDTVCQHICTCQPVCSTCTTGCSTGYWYPN
jgi:hypothetical protein